MRSTEIHVVIEDGSTTLGVFQEASHLRTNHRIQGEERTEEYDVACIDFGSSKLQLVVRMILVEDVVSIVVLIEES